MRFFANACKQLNTMPSSSRVGGEPSVIEMRWERVNAITKSGKEADARKGGGLGPGKKWGHTCNSLRNGRFLYVFGGYGNDNCQTNDVHVFDSNKQTWTKPVLKGNAPRPRDSHSCTTIGSCLVVFGGFDGQRPLRDLFILDTATNTWIEPEVHGEGPAVREGHSAALIGQRLFIFGGCGITEEAEEIYYNDLYILDTMTFSWTKAVTSGTPPSPRDNHTCSVLNNKIIVVGGEDASDSYLSDVYVLDTDTLTWEQLKTSGQNLEARAGHSTVSLGKHLFIFGGYTDNRRLYNDLHILNVETGVWTKRDANCLGPSNRFSVAGDCLDYKRGILVFIGGCNENLEALDDMYYLHIEMVMENVTKEQKPAKLSIRKELKRKRQEHHVSFNNVKRERDGTKFDGIHTPALLTALPGPTCTGKISLYDSKLVEEKIFEARITNIFHYGYTIESDIEGKYLRGLLFSYKPDFAQAVHAYLAREHLVSEVNRGKLKEPQKSKLKVTCTTKQFRKGCGKSIVTMDAESSKQVVISKPCESSSNQNIAFAERYRHPLQSAPFSLTPPADWDPMTNSGSGMGIALHQIPTSFQQSAPLFSMTPVDTSSNTNTRSGFVNALEQIPTSSQQSALLNSTPSIQRNLKPNLGSGLASTSYNMLSGFEHSSSLHSKLVRCDSNPNIESSFGGDLHSTEENAPTAQPTRDRTYAIPSCTSSCPTQRNSSLGSQDLNLG